MAFSVDSQDLGYFSEVLMELLMQVHDRVLREL